MPVSKISYAYDAEALRSFIDEHGLHLHRGMAGWRVVGPVIRSVRGRGLCGTNQCMLVKLKSVVKE